MYLSYADLWTISSPCQSISVAGKMEGLEKDSGTRSSLVWDSARLLQRAKEDGILPKYLLMENVKNLVSKKFKEQFDMIRNTLSDIGFNTYYKVLNAKDCGVPQNRERVFLIGIRKDIDTGKFEFPKPFDTGIRLKDVLDKDVDEKYYLSKEIQKRFHITDTTFTKNVVGTTIGDECTKSGERDRVYQENAIMGALASTDYKQPKQILETNNCIQIGDLNHYNYDEMNRVYSKEGCCPTLRTMQGGDRQPRIFEPVATIKEATKKGYAEICEGDSINLEQPNSKTRRGRVGKQIAQTLTTSCNQAVAEPINNLSHAEWKQQMFERFIEDCNGGNHEVKIIEPVDIDKGE